MTVKKIESKTTGMTAFTIAKGEALEWDVLQKTAVELTTMETEKAKALHFDLKKVLQVKQLLFDGKNPSQIKKETGIARTTVLNYKKNLDQATLDLVQKIHKSLFETTKKP